MNNIKILLVEDSDAHAMLVQDMLSEEKNGYIKKTTNKRRIK